MMMVNCRDELCSPDAVWMAQVKNASRSNRRVVGERSSPLHLTVVIHRKFFGKIQFNRKNAEVFHKIFHTPFF